MAVKAKISNTTIKNLVPEDKRLNDTEIAGFHARISEAGNIVYYLYYRINGKQVNFKIGAHGQLTPVQARDIAKEKYAEVVKGNDVQAQKKQNRREEQLSKLTTLDAFVTHKYQPWLTAQSPKNAEDNLKVMRSTFDKFYSYQLRDITAWEIERWRSEKLEQGMKPASINRRLNTLKGCLSRAVEWGVIESHDLAKVKALQVDNSRVRYLTDTEETALRQALLDRNQRIKDERKSGNTFRASRGYPLLPELEGIRFVDHLEVLTLLAVNTGMRKGELLSLKWADVNFEQAFLTIKAQNAKSGKTRHMPLNNEALDSLKAWRQIKPDTEWVFEGDNAKPIGDFKKSWAKLIEDAQIQDFRFHDLRHHFASKLVMKGVDLNTVRELLGHGNLEMTLRYAHLAPEHKSAAVGLLS